MRINPGSVIPSTEVLQGCSDGLTKHIKEAKSKLKASRDRGVRVHYSEKVYRLTIMKEEIQFLIDVL
jgi:hypothetical protein